MTAKVFMVTGATSGIGKALATMLAQTGEIVILVARDVDRGNAVVQEITQKTQNWNLEEQLCELAKLSSGNKQASVVKQKYNTINMLINKAAVYKRQRQKTVDGN